MMFGFIQADIGIWKFSKTDANTWDVTIQGESPVYITHQLFELGSGKPVTDHPVIGIMIFIDVC